MNFMRTAILGLASLALVVEFIGRPIWAMAFVAAVEDSYQELVVRCELGMVALEKASGGHGDSPSDLAALDEAKSQLMICHDHDLLRKRMLINGVSVERIQLIELRALEDQRIPRDVLLHDHMEM